MIDPDIEALAKRISNEAQQRWEQAIAELTPTKAAQTLQAIHDNNDDVLSLDTKLALLQIIEWLKKEEPQEEQPRQGSAELKEFYTLQEAADYIGTLKRSSLYSYIKVLGIETHKFPLKRETYLAAADVERIKQHRKRVYTYKKFLGQE